MEKLTHQELITRQAAKKSAKLPICALLNNIRSIHNVGSIFRTADGAGLEKLWLCGITPIPPSLQLTKTALGAEKIVPWEYRQNAKVCIEELKNQGYEIVALEQTRQSIPHNEFRSQRPVCLIVGNEIGGVGDELVPLCDTSLEIEMRGVKNSLNVSVAFGIVAYYLVSQYKSRAGLQI